MAITAPTKMTIFGRKPKNGDEGARCIYLPVALWKDSAFPFEVKEPLEATIINSEQGSYLIIRKSEEPEKVEG